MKNFVAIYHPTLGYFKGSSWSVDLENHVMPGKGNAPATHNLYAGYYKDVEMAVEVATRFSLFPDPEKIHKLRIPPKMDDENLFKMMGAVVHLVEDGDITNGGAVLMDSKPFVERMAKMDKHFGKDPEDLLDLLNQSVLARAGRDFPND
jgi:hypothetical protein